MVFLLGKFIRSRKVLFLTVGGVFMADRVVLECTKCKNRNYVTYKNKKNTSERLELKKYCKFCKEHTAHKETK